MNANKSLSQRLNEQLRQIIAETTSGERLLSEPRLAKQLGVSRATLREAMRSFETQGVIHRRQGVGTFVVHPAYVIETGLEVLESIHTLADRIGLQVELGPYQIEHRLPTDKERDKMDLSKDQKVVQVSWVIEAESRPVAYLIDVLPEDVLSPEAIHQEFSGSILDMLAQRGEISLTTSRTEISAVAARVDISRALAIQRGDVILCLDATLYSVEGRVVDYSHSYYLPGFFRFHVIRRVG